MRFNAEAYGKLFPRTPEEPKDETLEDAMIVEEPDKADDSEQDSVVVVKEQEVEADGDTGTGKPNTE